jgi:DNA-binding MarR family transcriptional regulator
MEIPLWARTPIGVYAASFEMRPQRAGRRKTGCVDHPTPLERLILEAIAREPKPIVAPRISDAIQASAQKRRDMHSYLKKLTQKKFVEIDGYVGGVRGRDRPLWKLTPKAREFLAAND